MKEQSSSKHIVYKQKKPSRENTYESASMRGTWMLMKTHIYHILYIRIASCRPDAYETTHITHISGILLKEYFNNVCNDVFQDPPHSQTPSALLPHLCRP